LPNHSAPLQWHDDKRSFCAAEILYGLRSQAFNGAIATRDQIKNHHRLPCRLCRKKFVMPGKMDTLWGKPARKTKGVLMSQSVYKIVTLVGSSSESWEKAATAAIAQASKSLRDLRIARVIEQDIAIEDSKPHMFRVKLEVAFKYEGSSN
jgi:flavin-binding protein dodecin